MEFVGIEKLGLIRSHAITTACAKRVDLLTGDTAFKLGMCVARINSVVITAKQYKARMYDQIQEVDELELAASAQLLTKLFIHNPMDFCLKKKSHEERHFTLDSAADFIIKLEQGEYEKALIELNNTGVTIQFDYDIHDELTVSNETASKLTNAMWIMKDA